MQLSNYPENDGETLWIATDRKLTIPEDSSITNLHEIFEGEDTPGVDLIIK